MPSNKRKTAAVATLAAVLFSGSMLVAPAAGAVDRSLSRLDYDGDGRTDPTILRLGDLGSTIVWPRANPTGDQFRFYRQSANLDLDETPMLGDYSGDGREDAVIYRPTSPAQWFVHEMKIENYYVAPRLFGDDALGDVPLHGDFTGDRRADLAVMRPGGAANAWYVDGWSAPVLWGSSDLGDVAVPADYDGDGVTDVAVRRYDEDGATTWHVRRSSGGTSVLRFGNADDDTAQGDYDNDGRADVAVVRYLANGNFRWFIALSRGGAAVVDWGNWQTQGDFPVWGDFTGDGRTDLGVWRPTSPAAHFLVRGSETGGMLDVAWGDGDQDLPASFALSDLLNAAPSGPRLSLRYSGPPNFVSGSPYNIRLEPVLYGVGELTRVWMSAPGAYDPRDRVQELPVSPGGSARTWLQVVDCGSMISFYRDAALTDLTEDGKVDC